MKTRLLTVCACLLSIVRLAAQTVPTPDHVVVVMMENHSRSEIIGANTGAPYINSLAVDSFAASFSNSLAITHPSQPNYLYLFSGGSQGVLGDLTLASFQLPLTSANLGAELLGAGLTFKGFSEDLPSVGYTGDTHNAYVRRHCPWVNWQGASTNGIPATLAQPFDSFPTNFNNLPTLCWVIPNLNDDMHDGSIAQGDAWLQTHIDAYVQWAKTHNSLLILDFDEDENSIGNSTPITTIFVGQMVKMGQYSEQIDHNRVLRTMEDMYGLGHAGASSTPSPITDCWVYKPVSAWASNPLNICSGQSVSLIDSSANSPTSWVWSFPGGSPSSATGKNPPAIAYSNPGTYDMQLITQNHMGYDTVVKTGYITVNSYPTLSVNPDTVSICRGSLATLTAGGATTYHWLNAAGVISTNNNVMVASPYFNATYYVTGSSHGCAGDTAAVIVLVDSLVTPAVSIAANPSVSACYGSVVQHTATLINGGPTPTYQWQLNGINVGNDSATFSTLAISGYSIKCIVTGSAQCATSPTVTSNTLNVTVSTPPTVTWPGGTETVYTNSGATTLTGGTPAGGVYSGTGVYANSFYADSVGPGVYTITYTYADANGCSNKASKTLDVVVATGINNVAAVQGLWLFPNPASAQLHIVIQAPNAAITEPRVLDASGRSIVVTSVKQTDGFLLDTHELADGMYLVKMVVDGHELVSRFVKGE